MCATWGFKVEEHIIGLLGSSILLCRVESVGACSFVRGAELCRQGRDWPSSDHVEPRCRVLSSRVQQHDITS